MKRFIAALVALTILLASPTLAMAKGYGGGRSYHSSSGGMGSTYSSSRSYSSSGSSLPSLNGNGGNYHSGSSSYFGGSKYHSGSTYHSGYTSPSYGSRTRLGGVFSNGFRGFGLSHLGSLAGGFILGSMFHPFGWGVGGGYFGGPGYYGGGWYNPMSSLIGIVVDLVLTVLVLWIIYRVFRAIVRRGRAFQPAYQGEFGSQSSMFSQQPFNQPFGSYTPVHLDLDEQGVVDACCEYVASRRRCAPQDIEVDLTFSRTTSRFGAEILVNGRPDNPLAQQDVVDAIAQFIASRERVDIRNVNIDLQFDEQLGITAQVSM